MFLDWTCIHGSTGEVVCVIKTTVRSGKPVLFPANGDIPNTSVTSCSSSQPAFSISDITFMYLVLFVLYSISDNQTMEVEILFCDLCDNQ